MDGLSITGSAQGLQQWILQPVLWELSGNERCRKEREFITQDLYSPCAPRQTLMLVVGAELGLAVTDVTVQYRVLIIFRF